MTRSRALVHFLALGALLAAGQLGYRAASGRDLPAPAPPGTPLRDEELLFRAALARGEHLRDPIVRWHLVRRMRLLHADAPGNGALFREALALGLQESDTTVRRRLVQRARLRAERAARRDEPGEEALRAYLARHPERWRRPARVRLTQIPLGPTPRAAGGLPIARDLPPLAERELAARFGARFAALAMTLPVGRWSGPVPSSYGRHRVFVHARQPGGAAPLGAVRAEVREALLAERAARILRDSLSELRRRFGIPRAEPAR